MELKKLWQQHCVYQERKSLSGIGREFIGVEICYSGIKRSTGAGKELLICGMAN